MRVVLGRTVGAASLLLLVALPAAAQDARREEQEVVSPDAPEASQAKGGGRLRAGAVPPAPDVVSAVVSGALAPADRRGGPGEAPELEGARWLALEDDSARVAFPSGERRLRVGDPVGPDRVVSLRPRQVVLERPGAAGEEGAAAVVVADFDGDGAPRVRVLWKRLPEPTQPLHEVR